MSLKEARRARFKTGRNRVRKSFEFKPTNLVLAVLLALGWLIAASAPSSAVSYESCATGFVAKDSGAVCEKRFTDSSVTSWSAPAGVTSVDVMVVGAGGNFGGTQFYDAFSSPILTNAAAGGGGGGEVKFCLGVSVGASAVSLSVGQPGALNSPGGTPGYGENGADGAPSNFGACQALGGQGARNDGSGGASGNSNLGGTPAFKSSPSTSYFAGGGGAGAGTVGSSASGSDSSAFRGGNGGTGLQPSSVGTSAGLFATDTKYYGGGGFGSGLDAGVAVDGTTGLGSHEEQTAWPGNPYYWADPNSGGGANGVGGWGAGATKGGSGVVVLRYRPAALVVNPTVTSVNPTSGSTAGGTPITITGTGFLTGATATVGGVTCTSPNVVSSTTLTCTTGAHATGYVNVVVLNLDTGSGTGTGLYQYLIINPTVSSVTPNTGPTTGGTSVTISGSGFVSGATVTIGGVACIPTSITAISITCTTGANSAGTYDIVVTNQDSGTGTGWGLFTYSSSSGGTSGINFGHSDKTKTATDGRDRSSFTDSPPSGQKPKK